MEPPTPAPEPAARHALLIAAQQQTGWTLEQLWVHYLALGGTAVIFDLEAHLADLNTLPPAEQDVLACAVNERLADLSNPLRLAYAFDDHSDPGPLDPLTVIDDLLAGDDRGPDGAGRSRPCLRRPDQDCPVP